MAPKRRPTRAVATKLTRRVPPVHLRVLSAVANRMSFSDSHGQSFFSERTGAPARDLYLAAGYDRAPSTKKFMAKYRRNGVARRLVNALPSATWRSGAELIEDDNVEVITDFEAQWLSLQMRLNVWDRMRKADVLAQLGPFSALLIGAVGTLQSELPRMKGPDDVKYLKQFSANQISIIKEDLVGYPFTSKTGTDDPRYGLPKFYTITKFGGDSALPLKVHYSRVIHIADETLEDDLYGEPRIASVYNWLDDLEKVAASGSEAFWQRVQAKLAAKLDPGVTLDATEELKVEEEIDKVIHGLRRWVRTSGISLEEIGTTDVANFDRPIDALISLIVAGYGLPKRILVGSERGELASSQDKSNWDQQIRDRRSQYAETNVVRPFVTRLVEHGALVTPEGYDLRWPDISDMDVKDKIDLGKIMSETNKNQGETVYKSNEIRDVVGFDALEEDEIVPIGQAEVAAARLIDAKQRKGDFAA